MKFLIPALSLAAVFTTGLGRAEAAGGQCQNTLSLSGWHSEQAADGMYVHSVSVRNLTRGMVSASVSYAGVGAISFRKTLQPFGAARGEIARTVAPIGQDVLSANTRLGCSIVG